MKNAVVRHMVCLMIWLPMVSWAQVKVSGIVKDKESGLTLPGVHVSVNSTYIATSADGTFTFDVQTTGDLILKATAVGYQPYEGKPLAPVRGKANYIILMMPDSRTLDAVVVSATRTENRVSNIPGRVEVITPEKIRLTGSTSIDQIISILPGVQTARSFGLFSHKATVSMRGVSGKEQARTLVLVDGIPVNKSDGGSVNWNLISNSEIERVEVLKGPGSALYGGNAMGGVINIVQKKPVESLEGHISADYGTYNTRGLKGYLGGKTGKGFYWAASGRARASDGYITQSYADQISNPYIVNSTFDEKVFSLRTGYAATEKFTAEVLFSYYDDRRETGEKVYQASGNSTDHDTYSIRATFAGKSGQTNWNAALYYLEEKYKRVSEWFKDDYTWYDVLSVRSDFGLLSGVSRNWNSHTFSGGLDIRHGGVDASDIYYTSTDQVDNRGKMVFYGLYIQDQYRFLKNTMTIVAGLRYDYSTFYDGAFVIHHPSAETRFMSSYQFSNQESVSWGAVSPRLSLQYKPDERYRIYTGYSRGFRPSVLDDLCRSGRVRGGFKIANPDLKPEYLDNVEAGFDYKPAHWAKFGVSIYYSRGKDFLYYVSTGDSIDMGFGNRPVMLRSNISDVDIRGVESDFTLSPGSVFSFYGSYAFNISNITGYNPDNAVGNVDLTGKYLTDVPKHSFTLGALMRSSWIDAGLTGRYTGGMYINDQNVYDDIVRSDQYPAVFTLDLKLERVFLQRYKASLILQNLLDEKIYESKMAIGPGRFIVFELGVRL